MFLHWKSWWDSSSAANPVVTHYDLLYPPGAGELDPEPRACTTGQSGFGLKTNLQGAGWERGRDSERQSSSQPFTSSPYLCCSQCLGGLSYSLERWKWVFLSCLQPGSLPFPSLWGAGCQASVLPLLLTPQCFRAVLARVCSPAWAAQIKLSQAAGSDTSSPVRSPFP